MKLVCFPHYTCGGLLCDILNGTFSDIGANGGINSIHHAVGKIGDANTVQTDFDQEALIQALTQTSFDQHQWAGTHCWPGAMPVDKFERIISVTTSTWKSKLYRWTRAYHHYFAPQWKNLSGMSLIDKTRETAKNYHIAFDPVITDRVINIEFADIVENTQEFKHLVKDHAIEHHMTRWQSINSFLYTDIWNAPSTHAFYQAEVEINLQRYYRYE